MASSIVITMNNASVANTSQLNIYSSTGKMMTNETITKTTTVIKTDFPTGIYYYKLTDSDNSVQTGKLISK